MNCPLCRRPVDDGTFHDLCRSGVDLRLSQIPGLYAALAAVLEPGSTTGARVSGSRTPPLPVRIEPLSLRGRGSIVTVLATWETDWRKIRGFAPVPARAGREQLLDDAQSLADVVKFLRAHLEWAVRHHPAIGEFACEVRDIAQECYRVIGATTDLKRIGTCPTVEEDGRPCGRILYADPYLDTIRCDRCRAEWPRARWLILGAAMNQTPTEQEHAA